MLGNIVAIDVSNIFEGAILRCGKCGHETPLNNRAGQYLNFGWPKCCKQTMTLVTKSEQVEESEE